MRSREKSMQTQVIIDEALVAEAMKFTELTSEDADVEEALRTFVRLKAQQKIRELRGTLHWEGDLDSLRENRLPTDNHTEN
jgi:Arc/MetJ family transcription regulator